MRVRKGTSLDLPWDAVIGPRMGITKDSTTWWYDEWVSDAMKGWDCMLGFNRSTSYQLYVSGGARDGDGQPARD